MVTTYQQNGTIIGIAKQSAKGTPNMTPDITLWYAAKPTFKVNQDKQDIEETHGFPIAQDAWIPSIEAKGDMSFYSMPVSSGYFFNACLGRDTKTGAGDPWTHTIDWGNGGPVALAYYTIIVSKFGQLTQAYQDARVGHLKLVGASNGKLMITVTWAGAIPTFQTSSPLSAGSVEKSLRMEFADGAAAYKFAGSALQLPNAFTFDVDRGLYVPASDTKTPADTVFGAFLATLQYTYTPGSFDVFNNVAYGSASPSNGASITTTPYEPGGSPAGISFKWTPQAASPGPERSLTLNMPRVQVDPFEDDPDVTPEALQRTVNVKAYGPAAGASPVLAVVLNGQTAAY